MEHSAIEWTDHTWNPWYGCLKVSQGCKHCYMYRDMDRYGRDPRVVSRSKTKFNEPLRWKDPAKVFTCSWSDFFIDQADEWRDEAWAIIRKTPHLTYQILTKRPENIADRLPADWREGYPNVWLGVSVENRDVTRRVWDLAAIPAAVRFVSAEPLLGPLLVTDFGAAAQSVDWIIVGGESGPGFRPMSQSWAQMLIDEAKHFNIPVFLKQLGGWPDKRGGTSAVIDGKTYTEFPDVPAYVEPEQMELF